MARKVQISKEVILEAALKMLIRDGYSAINITTLAKEIGCSTQPLVWHFDNMDGLRGALAEYAFEYANNKMKPSGENAVEAFEKVGQAFVEIAVKEPNLFHFLFLDKNRIQSNNTVEAIVTSEKNAKMIKRIADYLNIPEENVGRYLQNTMIYSHGIATLVVTGTIKASEEEMMKMINHAADGFLLQEGGSLEQCLL